jgi:hypothetical protein
VWGGSAFVAVGAGAVVVADAVPEVIAAGVWARREVGGSCVDISLWLARIGYQVQPDEVAVIASRYAQWKEDATRSDGGGPR